MWVSGVSGGDAKNETKTHLLAALDDGLDVLLRDLGVVRAEDLVGAEADDREQVGRGHLLVGLREATALHHHGVQLELLLGPLDDLLLHAPVRHESVPEMRGAGEFAVVK